MLAAGEDWAAVLARTGTTVWLNRVSFDGTEGEILVVMGVSGVTAMAPAVLREFWRETLGMVFQPFALFPHRTTLANVKFGLEI